MSFIPSSIDIMDSGENEGGLRLLVDCRQDTLRHICSISFSLVLTCIVPKTVVFVGEEPVYYSKTVYQILVFVEYFNFSHNILEHPNNHIHPVCNGYVLHQLLLTLTS